MSSVRKLRFKTLVRTFLRDQSGATAIEYGLIAATIGLGIIVSLTNVRDGYSTLYTNISDGLKTR